MGGAGVGVCSDKDLGCKVKSSRLLPMEVECEPR